MPDRHSLRDYVPVANQHPACPLCQAEMMLTRTMPAHLGFDIRTLVCTKCDRVEEVIVANDAFGAPGSESPRS
jgi:hypothetical protein